MESYDDKDARTDASAGASTVATSLVAPTVPAGFEVVGECPLSDVLTKQELKKLIGHKILYAWDDETTYGWFVGRMSNTYISARDFREVPRTNCIVSYNRAETQVKSLHGKVACELSKHLHGIDQWWVLLKKV